MGKLPLSWASKVESSSKGRGTDQPACSGEGSQCQADGPGLLQWGKGRDRALKCVLGRRTRGGAGEGYTGPS